MNHNNWFTSEDGTVPGWYDYQGFWENVIDKAPDGSIVVEIGVFCGKSVIGINDIIKRKNKNIKVYAVDIFTGSEEHKDVLSKCPKSCMISDAFNNIDSSGHLDNTCIIVGKSHESSKLFKDESVFGVFIDADHTFESVSLDIDSWLPKICDGGFIGGHDYHNFSGVKKAVDSKFSGIVVDSSKSWWEVGVTRKRAKLLITAMTYSRQMGSDVFNYCCNLSKKLVNNPLVSHFDFTTSYGYPTDLCRNNALKYARDAGYDYLVMIDDDMVPDKFLGSDKDAKPFIESSLNFAMSHDGPCVIAAPYCSAPPFEEVLVMIDREICPNIPDAGGTRLDKFTRHEAASMRGITQVSALPTGFILIDTRICDIMQPPWFSYEFTDEYNTNLASTEDVVFTRNASWLGIPQYCNWDCWCGHNKLYVTGKPSLTPITKIPEVVKKTWENSLPKTGE
jgi:hypothetical protein